MVVIESIMAIQTAILLYVASKLDVLNDMSHKILYAIQDMRK